MLTPVLVTAPAAPVLTLEEAKSALRVDFADDDAIITAFVAASTAHLEAKLQRALVTQTWRVDAAEFVDWTNGSAGWCGSRLRLRLPLQPVQSVSSVNYYDSDNAQQTLATSVYEVLSDDLGPYLSLKADQEWPTLYTRPDAIRVQFVAGYGLAAAVPDEIKVAIRLHLRTLYDPLTPPERESLQRAIDALTDLFRVFR